MNKELQAIDEFNDQRQARMLSRTGAVTLIVLSLAYLISRLVN